MKKISGKLIDIHQGKIYPADIFIEGSVIKKIKEISETPQHFILPGFIDSHIHIESSMLTPGSFAKAAVCHGTVAVVSDPHEIANVSGMAGVRFMIEDSLKVPLKFFFGAPSCVPATNFETSGAILNSGDIRELLQDDRIKYLSEMMNFPGVIANDKEIIAKIKAAIEAGKPVDGHAPGLSGDNLKKYVAAGISTDHECIDIIEANEKISLGMKILIREGSAARNLEALKSLIKTNPESVMLCSDDLHPEMLADRHIEKIAASLIDQGFDLFNVLRCTSLNPVLHYNLPVGLLRIEDPADFIIVDDPRKMNVFETWIDGQKVFDRGKVSFRYALENGINNFNCSLVREDQIQVKNIGRKIRVINAVDGELLTGESIIDTNGKFLDSDTRSDMLKIVVKDRYSDGVPAVGFIKGFGLKMGAFAGSVAHDSHNIVAIGTNDGDIVNAINAIVGMNGGLSVSSGTKIETLKLSIGGIISAEDCETVAHIYEKLSGIVKSFGCNFRAPFMTLSFMSLLVIPHLKISDKGLFDVFKFKPVGLFVD